MGRACCGAKDAQAQYGADLENISKITMTDPLKAGKDKYANVDEDEHSSDGEATNDTTGASKIP